MNPNFRLSADGLYVWDEILFNNGEFFYIVLSGLFSPLSKIDL